MAVLSDPNRAQLLASFMREASANRDALGLLKAELQAAINAADSWAEANAAGYNAALPQPARGALTARQKARILAYVILRRWEVS